MGTKEQFRGWLAGKGLTYTDYRKLNPEKRKAVWEQYEKAGRKKNEAVATCTE